MSDATKNKAFRELEAMNLPGGVVGYKTSQGGIGFKPLTQLETAQAVVAGTIAAVHALEAEKVSRG